MEQKDKAQKLIIDKYLALNNQYSTLVLPTGYGKSWVAIKIIKALKPKHVIIVVNSTILRDDSWMNEFEEFGMLDFYSKQVTTLTYQKMYKMKHEDFEELDETLIIFDEVDFMADTEKLSNAIKLVPEARLLGLTGYVTTRKRPWFQKYLPIKEEISTEEAQDLGLLNTVEYTFLKYEITGEETRTYIAFENKLKGLIAREGDLARRYMLGEITEEEFNARQYSFTKQIEFLTNDRSRFLTSLESSAKVARSLLKYLHSSGGTVKTVVFSKTAEQSSKISRNVYNSHNSVKENREIFRKFNESEITNLGAVSKINRGVNIKDLNVGVWEGFFGSDTQFIQQRGRLLRLKPDKIAKAFILLPYYKENDEFKPTQVVNWARKMLRTSRLGEYKVWDYLK